MEFFFEHILPIYSEMCIENSELREQSEDSSKNMHIYLSKYRQLLDIIKNSPMLRLKKQPLFVWHDRNSASWKFEEHRILHRYHFHLMKEAKAHFQKGEFDKAKNYLSNAVSACKDMISSLQWIKTPYVIGMPELQLEYVLALLFKTKGTQYYNHHMNKTSPLASKMAYKYIEIGNCLWKKSQDKAYENKLKAAYHHAVASTSEDFKEIISHSTAAVSLSSDPKILEDHQTWLQRNNSVHFETPDDIKIPLFNIEKAMQHIYA
jgi:tetratricopeptide (TPR) repeat protein